MTETQGDEPIDEIRQLRKHISERFENDPAKLVAHYLKLQEQYSDRLVRTTTVRERKDQEAV